MLTVARGLKEGKELALPDGEGDPLTIARGVAEEKLLSVARGLKEGKALTLPDGEGELSLIHI